MHRAHLSRRARWPGQPPAFVLGDLTLVRPLGRVGIPVIVGTDSPSDATLASRYVRTSRVLPGFDAERRERTARALLSIGEALHREVGRKVPLVYGSDSHLELIYRHRSALDAHFLLTLNDADTSWSLLDKERFYALCDRAGVRTPSTLPPGPDVARGLSWLREPLVVKPRRKAAWKDIQRSLFGGRGKARVFPTRAALLAEPAFARLAGELIVQEHIPGGPEDLLSFHAFADAEGELLAWFCGRKLRTYPAEAGESALIEVVDDPAVTAAGRDVATRLGLKGPFKVDLIRDARDGSLRTLEVNARYTLWHDVGAAAGVNLPRVAYDYQVHGRRPTAPPRATPGVRWISLYRNYLAFRERREAGPSPSLSAWLGPLTRRGTVHETFAWDDPRPFARWAAGMVVHKVAYGALRHCLGHSR